jgi:hypothetical protein
MKRFLFGITLFALVFTLAACAKKTSTQGTTDTSPSLSAEAELVVGTFKLEGTDQAITAEQAKTLLPLWQTLQSLSTSSTSATEEINALVDQIKSAMTTQQVDKITALKLTPQDMMTVMADAGLNFIRGASGTPNATPGADQQFVMGAGPADGGGGPSFNNNGGGTTRGSGGPSGSMPSGGGAPPSGGANGFVIQGDPNGANGAPGMQGTPQAVRGNGFDSQVPAPLLNALIELLQKKTQ